MERAHDNIGEGGSKSNSIVQISDGKVVLARKDGSSRVEFGEGVVGVDGMELFLCKNGSNCVDDEVHILAIIPEAIRVRFNKGKKLGEVGNLEQLVEGDESQRCESIGFRRYRGRWAIGKDAMCLCFDCSQLACCWGRKVIAQRVVAE